MIKFKNLLITLVKLVKYLLNILKQQAKNNEPKETITEEQLQENPVDKFLNEEYTIEEIKPITEEEASVEAEDSIEEELDKKEENVLETDLVKETQPDIKEEPIEKIEEQPQFIEESTISIVTDIHEADSDLKYILDRFPESDALICLGDYIHRDDDNSRAIDKISYIKSIIDNCNCSDVKIYCKGNHDNNTNNGAGYVMENKLPITPYGFVDIEDKGVRIIWINTSDYDDLHGDSNGKHMDIYGRDFAWNNCAYISLTQMQEIANMLSTTPKGYSVLLVGHYPTMGSGSFVGGFGIKPLINLIRLFKNHQAGRITYQDFINRDITWWNKSYSEEERNKRVIIKTNGPDDGTKYHVDVPLNETELNGYIDVDFTNNNNKFIAYIHGHTHNFTYCTKHKTNLDNELVEDFIELGCPAVCPTRNKGQTNPNTFECDYIGGEGCDDYYGITNNKDKTAGSHGTIINIDLLNNIFKDNYGRELKF